MAEQLDEDSLTLKLNSLLQRLELSHRIEVESPLDLTPGLILLIFESMLRSRLPISQETRISATPESRAESMKIFLRILDDDVLGIDAGLQQLDPQRLAEGGREEVLAVANVLCWLAKRMNYISDDGISDNYTIPSRDQTRDVPPLSPSVRSSSHRSIFSTHSSSADSQTTITQDDHENFIQDEPSEILSQPSYHHTASLTQSFDYGSPPRRDNGTPDFTWESASRGSRRLQEDPDDEDEEFLYCNCPHELLETSSTLPPPSIRTTGYLEEADLDTEIRSYEAQRGHSIRSSRTHSNNHDVPNHSRSVLRTPAPSLNRTMRGGIITKHTSPTEHTIALLEERARLLTELSGLRSGRR